MTSLSLILVFTVLISIIGLAGGLLLLLRKKFAIKLSNYLISFAAGALLSVSFFDILPESFSIGEIESILLFMFFGIISFYLIETFLIWHHCCIIKKQHVHSFNYLILIGDTFHNFLDGIFLSLAFLVSFPFGITAFFAIIFHEIPQEIGDFAILLYGKMKRSKIVFYNIISSLFSVVGAILAYLFIPLIQKIVPLILAFVAGGFIYVAISDLIPEARKEMKKGKITIQTILFMFGIFVLWLIGKIFES